MQKAQVAIELQIMIILAVIVAVGASIVIGTVFLFQKESMEEQANKFCSSFSKEECNDKTASVEEENFPCYLDESSTCKANTSSDRCSSASGCGEDKFFGKKFCIEKGIFQKFEKNYCTSGFCSKKTEEKLIQECGFGCSDGQCTECAANADCGPSGFIEENFCEGTKVYRKFVQNTCTGGACSKTEEKRLIESCSGECSNGECARQCTESRDCGTNGFFGENFCLDSSVYKKYKTYSCTQETCSSTEQNKLVQECENGCSNGACILQCTTNSNCGTNGFVGENFCQNGDVFKKFQIHSCQNNLCTSSDENRMVENCSGTCSEGICVPSCTQNSDCGTDTFIGSDFCSNGDIYKKFKKYTCENSLCKTTDENRLVTDCPGTCSNAVCQCVQKTDCAQNQYCDAGTCKLMDPNFFCGQIITSPQNIVLQGDVRNPDGTACTSSGLVIQSSNVFIDCAEYKITGVGGGQATTCQPTGSPAPHPMAGIHANPCLSSAFSGGGVKNCSISGVFNSGIVWNIKNGVIENNDIHDITYLPLWGYSGIFIIGGRSSGTIIRNNKINIKGASSYGILNDEESKIKVEANVVHGSQWGIYTSGRNLVDFDIINNEIFDNYYGIKAGGLKDSEILNNNVHDNTYGFYASAHVTTSGGNSTFHGNTLKNNVFNSNDYGFVEKSNLIIGQEKYEYCKDGFNNQLYNCYENDIDTSNTINGKPIYYFTPVYRMPNAEINGDEIGYFSCAHCNNNTLNNVKLNEKNYNGIFLYASANVTIKNSEISNKEYAAEIVESQNIAVTTSNLHDNKYDFYLKNFSGMNCNDQPCPVCNVAADCGTDHVVAGTLFCANTTVLPCQSSQVCLYILRVIYSCENHLCSQQTINSRLMDCALNMCYNNRCMTYCPAIPSGPEICDGIDNDCNALVDDNCT